MAYQPNVNWTNDEPPGFEADEMIRLQLGIADAASVADSAQSTAAQALSDAAGAQSTADEALAAVGSGGVHTVDDDVKRIYSSDTLPPDGYQPGDLVLSAAPSAQGPAAIPGLLAWVDASATGARDLSSVLPDVSGNGNDIAWRNLTGQVPASVASLNGLPAFYFGGNSRYSRGGERTGVRTFSGAVRFDAVQPNDEPLFYTGGSDAIAFGVRGGSGNLYCEVGSTVVYDAPLSWAAGGVAYVSFVLAIGTNATLWLSGVQVASVPVTGGGAYSTLALSAQTNAFFTGALGELAEHEGTAADGAQASALASYYRAKWRI